MKSTITINSTIIGKKKYFVGKTEPQHPTPPPYKGGSSRLLGQGYFTLTFRYFEPCDLMNQIGSRQSCRQVFYFCRIHHYGLPFRGLLNLLGTFVKSYPREAMCSRVYTDHPLYHYNRHLDFLNLF